MGANSWLWIALIGFLIFCCVSMLFPWRHKRPRDERLAGGIESHRGRDKGTER